MKNNQKTKIAPRGGVHYRRIGKLFSFLTVTAFFTTIFAFLNFSSATATSGISVSSIPYKLGSNFQNKIKQVIKDVDDGFIVIGDGLGYSVGRYSSYYYYDYKNDNFLPNSTNQEFGSLSSHGAFVSGVGSPTEHDKFMLISENAIFKIDGKNVQQWSAHYFTHENVIYSILRFTDIIAIDDGYIISGRAQGQDCSSSCNPTNFLFKIEDIPTTEISLDDGSELDFENNSDFSWAVLNQFSDTFTEDIYLENYDDEYIMVVTEDRQSKCDGRRMFHKFNLNSHSYITVHNEYGLYPESDNDKKIKFFKLGYQGNRKEYIIGENDGTIKKYYAEDNAMTLAWEYDTITDEGAEIHDIAIAEDGFILAVYGENPATLAIIDNNGSTYASGTVLKSGEKDGELSPRLMPGSNSLLGSYDFSVFSTNSGGTLIAHMYSYEDSTNPTEDPEDPPVSYCYITYHIPSGFTSYYYAPAQQQFNCGDSVTIQSIISNPMYSQRPPFIGWHDKDSGETYESYHSYTFDSDVDLYASFEGVEYCTITYHIDNSVRGTDTFVCGNPTALSNTTVSMAATVISMNSGGAYSFSGWYDNAELAGDKYTFGSIIESDMDLYGESVPNFVVINQNGMRLPSDVDPDTIHYDESSKELTLSNYTGKRIQIDGDLGEINLILEGVSTISSQSSSMMMPTATGLPIQSSSSIIVSGEGVLNIQGGVRITGDLTVNNGSLNLGGTNVSNYTQNGGTVNVGGSTTMNMGGMIMTNTSASLSATEEFIINGGAFTSSGIYLQDAHINGGEVTINKNNNASNESILSARSLYVDGGTLTLLNGANKCYTSSSVFIMNNGEVNSSCEISSTIFVLNEGNLTIDTPTNAIRTELFNLNGGSLDASCGSEQGNKGHDSCIDAHTLVFNDGAANIRSTSQTNFAVSAYTDAAGQAISSSDDLDNDGLGYGNDEERTAFIENNHIVFAKNGTPINFNGGDIKISSSIGAVSLGVHSRVGTDCDCINAADFPEDWGISFGENMVTDPAIAPIKRSLVFEYGDGDESITANQKYITTFSDGEDPEFEWDEDEWGITSANHALRSIHIYKSKAQLLVPSTDKDEENPNTLDSKIVIILATVASSIAAEGIIIGDLTRRLYNYKKAISSNFPPYPQY